MSAMIRAEHFTGNLFFILEETFESPPRPGNAYLDKQTGWFATLADITAEEASCPVVPGGTTIAAQVEHARFYLEALEAFMQRRLDKVDWRESWGVREVTAEEWQRLTDRLRSTYARVKASLYGVERWEDDDIGDALAILTHSAYHLGAIRQMIRVVRQSRSGDATVSQI